MKTKISKKHSTFAKFRQHTAETDQKRVKKIPSFYEWCGRCKIRSGGTMVSYKPYESQLKFIECVEKYSITLMAKSRQLGVTQTAVAWMCYKACYNPAWVSAVFCLKQSSVSNVSARARQMILSAGFHLITDNTTLLRILGGGEIHFQNSAVDGLRSLDSVCAVLFDEAAFMKNIRTIYASSVAATSMVKDAKIIIISTPPLEPCWYWSQVTKDEENIEKLLDDVAEGKISNGFHYWVRGETCKILYHWRSHPVYGKQKDYLKYRQEKEGCDDKTLQREHNLRFIYDDEAVFPSATVRFAHDGYESQENGNDYYEYFAGLDCATTGTDNLVLSVYRKNLNTKQIHLADYYMESTGTKAEHIAEILKLLDTYEPTLSIETSGGVGQVYLEDLSLLRQHLIIKSFVTSQISKAKGVSKLRALIEQDILKFPKECPLTQELLHFKQSGMRFEAESGFKDDFVMSTMFAMSVT